MAIPESEYISWDDSEYLRKSDTFDIWRKKTNGLGFDKVNRTGDTMTGTLTLNEIIARGQSGGYVFFAPKNGTDPISNADRFEIRVDPNNQISYVGNFNEGTGSARALSLTTAGTDRIFITTDGNVGIGTTTPSSKLHVNGNIKCGNYLNLRYNNDPQITFANTDDTERWGIWRSTEDRLVIGAQTPDGDGGSLEAMVVTRDRYVTLAKNPANDMHAATKGYVDAYVDKFKQTGPTKPDVVKGNVYQNTGDYRRFYSVVIYSGNDIYGFGAFVGSDNTTVTNSTARTDSSCVCWHNQVSDGSGDDGTTMHFIVPKGYYFKVDGPSNPAIIQVTYYEI